jgi:hypothetical protein
VRRRRHDFERDDDDDAMRDADQGIASRDAGDALATRRGGDDANEGAKVCAFIHIERGRRRSLARAGRGGAGAA